MFYGLPVCHRLVACYLSQLKCKSRCQRLLSSSGFRLITVVLMTFFVCNGLFSQNLNEKVEFGIKKHSLDQALLELDKLTEFRILYSVDLVSPYHSVSLEYGRRSVEETLRLLLFGTNLTYEISGKNIMIVPSVEAPEKKRPPKMMNVSGKITDNLGNDLEGVVVRNAKHGNQQVISGQDGGFSIEATEGDVLLFSYLGFQQNMLTVVKKSKYSIVLSPKENVIDEIQIVGYGTTTKRLNTGSVSTIKGDVLDMQPVNNILQALQGQLPGVGIVQKSGGLNVLPEIYIRGVNSLAKGNPLVLLDGIDIDMGSLNYINLKDIASVDVLKDADATSIYGSRGTNGVILITTRKWEGTDNKTKFDFDFSMGQSTSTYITPRLNTTEYLRFRKDAFAMGNYNSGTGSAMNPIDITTTSAPDLTDWSQAAYTDWNKYQLQNYAPLYKLNGKITGGNQFTNFQLSGGYTKLYDITPGNPHLELLTGRVVLDHKSADSKFKININGTFSFEKKKNQESTSAVTDNSPNFEMYDSNGYVNFAHMQNEATSQYTFNPVPSASLKNEMKCRNIIFSTSLLYQIINGLIVKISGQFSGYTIDQESLRYSTYFPFNTMTGSYSNPQLKINSYPEGDFYGFTSYTSNIEPQITYSFKKGDNGFDALLGSTFLDKRTNSSTYTVKNPGADDLLRNPEYSVGGVDLMRSYGYSRFHSVYGRVTYNYGNKYVLNITDRADVSSKFGYNNRRSNFYSLGAAWIFSSEKFIRNNLSFLSFAKIRGSFGTTGNYNIPDYQDKSPISDLSTETSNSYRSYNNESGFVIQRAANPNLKWEDTQKVDVSMKVGFFRNRILLSADFYNNTTTNLLTVMSLPTQTGWDSYYGNLPGKIRNRGLELELTTNNLSERCLLKWQTQFTLTFNKNTLVSYPGLDELSYSNQYKIGRAIVNDPNVEMPYHSNGVDPETGYRIFKDVNGDKLINLSDQGTNASWIGSTIPTGFGGLTNTLNYKGFGLSVFVQYSYYMMTTWSFGGIMPGQAYNPSKAILNNYWKQPGDNASYPRLWTGDLTGIDFDKYYQAGVFGYLYTTDDINKGVYFRLKNLQLSYNLQTKLLKRLKMDEVRFYIKGENLCFINTGKKLWKDPEIQYCNSDQLLRTVCVGCDFSF